MFTSRSMALWFGLASFCLAAETAAPAGDYRQLEMRGWNVHVSSKLGTEVDKALEILDAQLAYIASNVPTGALPHLRAVPLWLSPEYPGSSAKAEYHPSAGWLRENGRDPAMAKAVEFTNIRIFEKELRRMPVFVLHELAHAFHDRVLGFSHPEIRQAHRNAEKAGIYEAVPRNDGRTNRAYAITDHKEYFAELTESYFGTNDFYPFTGNELKQHDPAMHKLLEKLWSDPPVPPPAGE